MPLPKSRSSSDMTKPEQKVCKPEKEGHDPFDNIIRQTIGKEPFMSFSRAGENHVQWIQLLHALDQQGTNKLSKGSKAVNVVVGKDWIQEPCNGVSLLSSETNGFKDSMHSKATGTVKGAKLPSEHIHHHKIPEIVAFTAAKANGESEKYFPGWPLSLPSKVQMQKCEKCSREFCSTINYRRHIRIHRRSLNIDKDSSKNRDYLSAFWDKLSFDGAMEIVSFKDVLLEEVTGSSIIKTLTGFVRKPGFTSLPQAYMKAGSALLDIIQARPSKLPISSKELFAILDDASERTFLCAGTAVSLRKFVFDGEAAKIGLEPRNIVACTSFLIEQRLVTAWLADKDAEALRCQKLLVEEEEAAQKRQAELLEKRRLKKLRHREQRVKDHAEEDTSNVKDVFLLDLAKDSSSLIETPSLAVSNIVDHEGAESTCNSTSPAEPAILTDAEGAQNGATGGHVTGSGDMGANYFHDSIGATTLSTGADGDNDRPNDGDITGSVETNTSHLDDPASEDPYDFHGTDVKAPYVSGKRYLNMARRQAIRQPRYVPNVLTSGPENGSVSKSVSIQKHGVFKDQRVTSQTNSHKVWTRKLKVEDDRDDIDKEGKREVHELREQKKDCEVLIGSISIALSGTNVARQDGDDTTAAAEPQPQNCIDTNQLGPQPTGNQLATKRTSLSDKKGKSDSGQTHVGHCKVKLWRPVGIITSCRNGGTMEQISNLSCDNRDTDCGGVADKMAESCTAIENCCRLLDTEEQRFHNDDNSSGAVVEAGAVNQNGSMSFSSHAAQIFLIERWKEAISGDHVTVVISPEMEVSLTSVNSQSTAESSPFADRGNDDHKPCSEGFEHAGLNPLASTENRLASAELHNSTNSASNSRPRSNSLKSSKLKYIPKQRNGFHQ
ncbi:uncharacterized protein LOC116265641 isoform X1 [Nymphaea colorata]|nr:uncharacterized protein LOC116265641 isoform X1 [Nymphaea colorata]XP_031502245.1 uncharacterized protein LOC116265641 isoform X1 [Nymphaea colorata]